MFIFTPPRWETALQKTISGLLLLALFLSTASFSFAASQSTTAEEAQDAGGGTVNANPRLNTGEVTAFDGSLLYEYPIEVPPGRNGLQPNHKLIYSSHGRTPDSLFGYGWSIDIPHISRWNRTGLEDLYDSNDFVSSLDGELISQGGDSYQPRTENGEYLKYEFSTSTNVWTVTDKRGTVYTFGSTTASRQDNPDDSSEIFKWMLTAIEDTNGNTVEYSYFKDQGQIYPGTTTYNQEGLFEVVFNRTSRTSASTTHTGFPVITDYYIDSIDIEVDGDVVKTYEFEVSSNLIRSITVSGVDGAETLELPLVDFTYAYEDEDTSFTYQSTWDITQDSDWAPGIKFADVNGDGLVDMMRAIRDGGALTAQIKLNGGSTWLGTGGWTFPDVVDLAFHSLDNGHRSTGQIADVDGDGLIDLVDMSDDTYEFYINNGSGWSYDSTWDLSSQSAYARGTSFADVNGDGLPDMITIFLNSSSALQRVIKINTGSGWTGSEGWTIPNDDDLALWDDDDVEPGYGRLLDVNGDGLIDLANLQGTDYEFYINNGAGWSYSSLWDVSNSAGYNKGTQFADVNGDGLPDLVTSYIHNTSGYKRSIKLNNGAGWGGAGGFSIPDDDDLAFWDDVYHVPGQGRMGDFNGDGLIDLIDMANGGDYEVHINDSKQFDHLESISNTYGGTTTYNYIHVSQQDSGGRAPGWMQAVNYMVTDDGNGNVDTTTFEYKAPDFYYAGPFDKRFAGYASTTRTDPVGTETIRKYHQGNGTSSEELVDSYSRIGQVYEKTIRNIDDDVFLTERTNFEETNIGSTSTLIQVESILTRQYDGFATSADSAIGYAYDSYGNVISKIEYGGVSGSSDGTFTDSGSDKRTTNYTYATNTSAYIVGLPETETVRNNAGTKVKESRFYYDNQSLGSVTDGNLTKREDWITSSDYAEHEWAYNGYGLVTSYTDPRNKTATNTYDTNNLYVATTTNAEGHVMAYTYDYSSGKVEKTIDAEGRVFETTYDLLDRPEYEYIPEPATGARVVKTHFEYTDTKGAVSVKREDRMGTSTLYGTGSGGEELLALEESLGLTNSQVEFPSTFLPENDPIEFDDPLASIVDVPTTTETQDATSSQEELVEATLVEEEVENFETPPAVSVSSISERLQGKNRLQKADIKAREIAASVPVSRTRVNDYDVEVEIIDSNVIKGGVEVFARAWENGRQIGFGVDGSVDLERFKIYNPPVLVEDRNGDVVREWYDETTGESGVHRYREDPEEAILQTIAHAVSTKKEKADDSKIEKNTVGNTTSVFYPSHDGRILYQNATTWDQGHDASSGNAAITGDSSAISASTYYKQASDFDFYRSIYVFDTSSLGAGAPVSSATFSLYADSVSNGDNDGNDFINVVEAYPASESSIANADYDQIGDSVNNPTEGSTRIDLDSVTTGDYNDFALNTEGLTWIDKTGNTVLGLRIGFDMLDHQIAFTSTWTRIVSFYVDETGTTKDPKLVVEHSGDTAVENTAVTYTYYDGFGKPIQERKLSEDDNVYAVRDIVYGKNGQIKKESLPYFATSSSRTSVSGEDDLFTEYGYDALKRITAATTSVGTTNTAYDRWTETVTDALGNDKKFEYDALGRLSEVTEHNSTSTYVTTYEWDALDNLTKITDALGNVRNLTYDGLSRRTELEDLHGTADTTYGVWDFTYDDSGNLTSQTDPKSQTVNYTYDNVNRMLTENYTGAAGVEVSYSYDSCTLGEGRLCSVANGSATTTYTYDYAGNIATTTRTVEGTDYTSYTEHNRQGNPKSITYPDGSVVAYTYNNFGELERIDQSENGVVFDVIISDFDYGSHGLVTYQLHGNGASTTKLYGADELYRLKNIITETSTSTYGVGSGGEELRLLEMELGLVESFNTTTSEVIVTEPEEEAVEEVVVPASEDPAPATSTPPDVATSTPETEEGDIATTTPDVATTTPETVATTTDTTIATTTPSTPTTTPEVAATSTVETEVVALDGGSPESVVEPRGINEAAATSTHEVPLDTISAALEGKPYAERVAIKSDEVAKLGSQRKTRVPDYAVDIEIVSVNRTQGGVEVFARAWEKGRQLGFGRDGTVDIERFRIFNPPILVEDKNGDITREWVDEDTGEIHTDTYREDVLAATLEGIAHTISIKKEKSTTTEIVTGRVGNTTSTYYPSHDGRILKQNATTWNAAHDATSGNGTITTDTSAISASTFNNTASDFDFYRSLYVFDTSSLPDTDEISAATFSLYVNSTSNGDNDGNDFITVVQGFPANEAAIANGDYDQVGNSIDNPSEGTDGRIDIDNFTTSAYNDFTLNSTGEGWIDATGNTVLGTRIGFDVLDHQVALTSTRTHIISYYVDETGTTKDPKLVVEHSAPATSSEPTIPTGTIQQLAYTYDAIGNITQIVDASKTLTAATTTYTYDDLQRLASASTTLATSTGYSRTFSYNAIGNIDPKSDQGSYSYQGDQLGRYANPHAVTQIASVTYGYDRNGNLATSSAGLTNTWDYKNRLTQSSEGGVTVDYEYDHENQRVLKDNGTTTTHYPFSFYEYDGSTSTKHVYANDALVATIVGSGTSSVIYANHLDHLQGTAVVTDEDGAVTQTLSYYPFGDMRIDQEYGTVNQTKRFTGHDYDNETSLSYQGARYYAGDTGRFTSQDPVSLALGDWKILKEKTSGQIKHYLQNPQAHNSYSYTANNPLKYVDPNGEAAVPALPVFGAAGSFFGPAGTVVGLIVGGVVVTVGGVYATNELVENGTIQVPKDYYIPPPMQRDPNKIQPPRGGLPTWQKILYGILGAGVPATEKYLEFKDQEEGVQEFIDKATSDTETHQSSMIQSSGTASSNIQSLQTIQSQLNSIRNEINDIRRKLNGENSSSSE